MLDSFYVMVLDLRQVFSASTSTAQQPLLSSPTDMFTGESDFLIMQCRKSPHFDFESLLCEHG